MKCQVCNTKENIQVHHPNYNDYLKVNLLCKKHHDELHRFELIPPLAIDLEKIAVRKPPQQEKTEYINEKINEIINDALKNNLTYEDLSKKYEISRSTLKTYFIKQKNWEEIKIKMQENTKKSKIERKNTHKNNPLLNYKKEHNLTSREISEITNIPLPTIRAIEIGKTKLENIKELTKQKLKKIGI